MRIGFDATGVYGQLFGIQSYAKNLLLALMKLDFDHELVVFCRREIPESFAATDDARLRFVVGGYDNRKLTEQLWLPRALQGQRGLDCFHATYGRPMGPMPPVVHTLHDLFLMHFPRKYSPSMRLYHRIAVERGTRLAARVIAVSEATKRDAVALLDVPEDRISVVPHGVDIEAFRPVDPERDTPDAFRERHRLPSRYLLHLGGFSPIKNTVRIVDAFAGLCRNGADRGLALVFAGRLDQLCEATQQAVARHGLQARVHFTDYFPGEDLPELMRYADALIYPSLIEGFGLPLLEAQASGTPVITSDRFSMPEVAGPTGLLIDPEDTAALTAAMTEIIARADDPLTPDQASVAHARRFLWTETARRTLAAYETAGAEPAARR